MFTTLAALALPLAPPAAAPCQTELVVLGTSQDAGTPQIGHPEDPAWRDPTLKAWAASLALVDHASGRRYLFDATPDLREQLEWLDTHDARRTPGLGLDGIFLTHAHIGHYAGLMFLGRESANTRGVPVYAMPRMAAFLTSNGPWSQLVSLGNIALQPLAPGRPATLPEGITVTPWLVPHRDEYSETVGFVIAGPGGTALYLPDIDSWEKWDQRLEDMLAKVDVAYVDGTFFDDTELGDPARMKSVPHPRIADTIRRLPPALAAKVHFIHLNHTNPARFPDSAKRRAAEGNGAKFAALGERFCLSKNGGDRPISPR
jgi:pyrroloquinoline quinone biosynthesis protein B